jgi:hypothetical protein
MADTSPEPPSALLERAAERLAELAAHYADYVDAQVPGISRWDSPAESWSYDAVDRNATSTSRAWIETMNPSVAQPLVEWLRDTAASLRAENEQVMDSSTDSAIAFARVVLGESP